VKPRLIKRFHFSTKKQGSMQPALITELWFLLAIFIQMHLTLSHLVLYLRSW
jgi:hypothetical protein